LGWLHSLSAISSFVNLNQQTQLTLPQLFLEKILSRNHKCYRISFLILLNFTVIALPIRLSQAEAATSAIPKRLLIPRIVLDSACWLE
jgi:hypothetical protein